MLPNELFFSSSFFLLNMVLNIPRQGLGLPSLGSKYELTCSTSDRHEVTVYFHIALFSVSHWTMLSQTPTQFYLMRFFYFFGWGVYFFHTLFGIYLFIMNPALHYSFIVCRFFFFWCKFFVKKNRKKKHVFFCHWLFFLTRSTLPSSSRSHHFSLIFF